MKNTKAKINRADVLEKVRAVMVATTNDPAEELRTTGKALIGIADAIQGMPRAEALAVIQAAQLVV